MCAGEAFASFRRTPSCFQALSGGCGGVEPRGLVLEYALLAFVYLLLLPVALYPGSFDGVDWRLCFRAHICVVRCVRRGRPGVTDG